MKKEYYIQVCRYLLTVLWIYAAGSKLWFYAEFKIQLARQPLPEWSITILSWALPLAEFITVALLSFQMTLSKGLLLSALLLFAFTVYVGLGLFHVYNSVPCVCGGILGKMGWGDHFIFNICFTIIAFTGWILTKSKNKRFIRFTPINA